jgi:SAM-dependent methyltransferase
MRQREHVLAEVADAYAGLEDSASFPNRGALERYRATLLERSREQADFLARRLRTPARALEFACGNGRLLVALATRGIVDSGVGTDIATSRIDFATAWAEELSLPGLRFVAEDLLETPVSGDCDLALCITGALGYFEPAEAGLGLTVTRRLHDALVPGGLACVELYPHPGYRRLLGHTDGEARIWHELPMGDPWRFYLSHLRLDGDVLTHAKTFVHRHDGSIDEGRRERLLLYTPASLTTLLEQAGLEDIRLYEGWSEQRYAGGEVIVATAKRHAS